MSAGPILHIYDRGLPHPTLPLILGHQIVGKVSRLGSGVKNLSIGQRVGVPWLGGSCQACRYCLAHQENLCDHAVYTGYQKNGGLRGVLRGSCKLLLSITEGYSDIEAAPLMCAGLIGYRALRFTGSGKSLGIYGFGSGSAFSDPSS